MITLKAVDRLEEEMSLHPHEAVNTAVEAMALLIKRNSPAGD